MRLYVLNLLYVMAKTETSFTLTHKHHEWGIQLYSSEKERVSGHLNVRRILARGVQLAVGEWARWLTPSAWCTSTDNNIHCRSKGKEGECYKRLNKFVIYLYPFWCRVLSAKTIIAIISDTISSAPKPTLKPITSTRLMQPATPTFSK